MSCTMHRTMPLHCAPLCPRFPHRSFTLCGTTVTARMRIRKTRTSGNSGALQWGCPWPTVHERRRGSSPERNRNGAGRKPLSPGRSLNGGHRVRRSSRTVRTDHPKTAVGRRRADRRDPGTGGFPAHSGGRPAVGPPGRHARKRMARCGRKSRHRPSARRRRFRETSRTIRRRWSTRGAHGPIRPPRLRPPGQEHVQRRELRRPRRSGPRLPRFRPPARKRGQRRKRR